MNKPYIWMDDLGTWFTDEDYQNLDDSLKEDMVPLYVHQAIEIDDDALDVLINDMPESPSNDDLYEFAHRVLRKAQEK